MESSVKTGIQPGGSLIYFDLPDSDGGRVHLRDYHGRRNLVLFFLHDITCSLCRAALDKVSYAYNDMRAQEADLVVIVRGSKVDASSLKRDLKLRCPVLFDESGDVFRRYGLNEEMLIIVSDRFGEIYHVFPSGGEHGLPSAREITSWLEFIQIQCPECGAPEWPSSGHT